MKLVKILIKNDVDFFDDSDINKEYSKKIWRQKFLNYQNLYKNIVKKQNSNLI